MRTIAKLSLIPLGLFAVACGGKDDRRPAEGLSDDLRSDLALAAAAGVELASSAQTFDRARVVSAIERPPGGTPRRATAPRKSPGRRPTPSPTPTVAAEPEVVAEAEQVTPQEAAAEEVVVAEPTPSVIAEAPAPAPMPEPPAVPRPAPPVPVSYPGNGGAGSGDDRGDLGGIGPVIGTVIGVVIRGGGVGVDRCEIHHPRARGRPGVMIAINERFPARGRPTFPRY